MDRYQRVEKPRAEAPIDENEISITSQGTMRSYISYAMTLLQVEQLEQEVSQLRKALDEKQEQENAMLQILMRMEQEQRVTKDARQYAEQDATAQRYAAKILQEKYEEAIASFAEMKRPLLY